MSGDKNDQDGDPAGGKEARDWPAIIGAITTALYIGGIGFYLYRCRAQIVILQPNNLGDYLAGIFGPLAFLWLVIGYIQQGRELRMNGRALMLQAHELNESVKQHVEMVAATKEQVRLSEAALQHSHAISASVSIPRLEFERCRLANSDTQEHTLKLAVLNGGIFNIRVEISNEWELGFHNKSCAADHNLFVSVRPVDAKSLPKELYIDLSYNDVAGDNYNAGYRLVPDGVQEYVPKPNKNQSIDDS